MPSTLAVSGQPLTLNIEPARNYIGVLPQVNTPLGNIDCHRLKAPTCYVEVTSFKFIRLSAFCPEWGREVCRETTDILLVAGNAHPRGQ